MHLRLYMAFTLTESVYTATINFSTEPLEPPDSIQLTNIIGGQVVLTWIPVPQSTVCLQTYYRVTSNCSTCNSGTTSSITASCPLPQHGTDGLVCVFSVQGVVCGNLTGRLSNSLVVTLQGTQYSNRYSITISSARIIYSHSC